MVGSKTRYTKAKEIVTAAMAVEPTARPDFLRQSCGDDLELKQEVDWLIEAMDAKDAFLEVAPVSGHEPGDDAVMQVQAPRDYRILRRLGEGGHGVVFLAERTDGKYVQLVALKLLNFAGHLNPIVTARFDLERQILARLTHPNIAQLMDGGTLKNGHPFLAMEYVDGTRIDEYCRTHQLGTEDRLRLFLKVCAAVAYAHQQLVIHRDLKPANVLVTEQGEPKLLDFGVARLMSAADDPALPPTQDAGRLLTLLYASPEQIRGEPLSTTSDVYSLGVLLYELLTGVLPFVDDVEHVHRLSRDICETEPTKPSRRVMTGRTGGASRERTGSGWWQRYGVTLRPISPDLDAITLKALRKRPEDRYDSVRALSDDLKRFLSSRPVLARKGHVAYRARRYLQRHRWAVAAAATFVVLIVGFAANRQVELQRTQLERDKARQVTDFMSELFSNANPSKSKGETITVREMLDRGARQVAAREGLDATLKGSMLSSIGNAYNGLGLPKDAISALTVASSLYDKASASPAERAEVQILLAEAHAEAGDFKASVAGYNAALGLLHAASGDHADAIASAEIGLARNHVLAANKPLAPLISELENKARALEAGPPGALLVDAYSALGMAHESASNNVAAAASYERAIKAARSLYGADSLHVLTIRGDHAKATVSVDPAKGARLLKGWLEDYRRVVGERNTVYAIRLNDLAVALGEAGQRAEAIPVYQEARAIARAVAGPTDRYFLQFSTNLAIEMIKLDRKEEAAALLRENLPVLAARVDTGVDRLAYAHNLYAMGRALEHRDDPAAERSFMNAERALGPEGPAGYFNVYEAILYRLTDARIRQHRYPQAEQSLAKLQEFEGNLPADADRKSHLLRIDLLLAQARYDEAARLSAALAAAATPKSACSDYAKRIRAQYSTAVEKGARTAGAPKLPECKPAS